jgi:hypothetical protein
MSSKSKSGRRSVSMGSVDVHCHVFNAQDVPVRKFVELVYLEKDPGGPLLNPLIDFIELIMRFGAPTTREEIDSKEIDSDLQIALWRITLPGAAAERTARLDILSKSAASPWP